MTLDPPLKNSEDLGNLESGQNCIVGVIAPTSVAAPMVGLKMQSNANTDMKSLVSCFSSLLNFSNNELTQIN